MCGLPGADCASFGGQVPNTTGYVEPGREGKPPKKQRDIVLTGLGADLPVEVWTPSGWPACSGAVLKGLAGKVAIDWATPEVDEDGDGPAEPPDSDAEVGRNPDNFVVTAALVVLPSSVSTSW